MMKYSKMSVFSAALVMSLAGCGDDQDEKTVAVPAAPMAVSVTTQSNSTLAIAWDAVDTATSYAIHRSAAEDGTYEELVTELETTDYSDEELSADTEYWYKVLATNAGGNSDFSEPSMGKTLPLPPEVPTGLVVTAQSISELSVAWDEVTGAISYDLHRSDSETGNYTEIATALEAAEFDDTGLSTDTEYWYKVLAHNAGGSSDLSAPSSGITHPMVPTAPSSLLIAALSTSELHIVWEAVPAALSYDVHRADSEDGSYTEIVTGLESVELVDDGLSTDTEYWYKVLAINRGGASEYSSTAAGLTWPLPPEAPSTINVSTVSGSSLKPYWLAVDGATSYDVYRSDSEDGTYALITADFAEVDCTSVCRVEYTDEGLNSYTEYWYKALARNRGGESGLSAAASGLTRLGTPDPVIAAVSQTTVTISWEPIYGATHYTLSYAGGGAAPTTLSEDASSPFVHTGLVPTTDYSYWITASNDTANPETSPWIPATTLDPAPPAAPENLTVVGADGTSLFISWDAVIDATHYIVYRDSAEDGTFETKVFEGALTSFINSGLANSTTYFYKVFAFIGVSIGDDTTQSGTTGTAVASSTITQEYSDATGVGSTLFGFRASPTALTIAHAQSVLITSDMILDSFAFNIGTITQDGGALAGDPITLRLDVRDAEGDILVTNERTITEHSSGWFVWDGFSEITLLQDETYIFSTYILDSRDLLLKSSMVTNTTYAEGDRYTNNSKQDTNLELELWTYLVKNYEGDWVPANTYLLNDSSDLHFLLEGH